MSVYNGRMGRDGLPWLSAAALSLSFYPWRQEWLVWLALVPLLVWLADPTLPRRRALIGLAFVGTVYHIVLLVPFLSLGWWGWGLTTARQVVDYFSYQRFFLCVLLGAVSLWGGVVMAMVGWLIRPFLRRPLAALWVVPSAWVLMLEYLGHGSVFGFTWGLIGNRLHGLETMRQLASVVGVYGLSFLVVMVNAFVASWIVTRGRRSRWVATGVVLGVVGASCAYGTGRLHRVERGPTLAVALLQGAKANYTLDDYTREGFDRDYGRLLETAVRQQPSLIVLPETVWFRPLQVDGTTTPWARDPLPRVQMYAVLARHLAPGRVMAIGTDVIDGGRMSNATAFWRADGLAGLYRKQRLVPFAEYRPAVLGRWAPQNVIHGSAFAYAPGQGSQLVRVLDVAIGAFICQEVMFPSLVRRSVRDGAQLLVTTGNDGVFASPVVAREQANLATLRAVENGRYLLRSMKSGVSAVIDPQGRVLASLPVNTQGVIASEVRSVTTLTWYTRYGDWIVWLSACVLIVVVLGRIRAGTHRRASP